MKLTQQNIQDLYKFTRQHYVEHYDVQTELVDHLANDIEEIWVEQPNLSFIAARDKSFKKFGIFGFMDVVETKQKQMSKRYWKIILRFVKEWFQLPKIIVTITIFLLFFVLLQIKYSQYLIMGVLLIFIISEMIMLYRMRKKQKEKEKKKEKIFLLEAMIGETKNGTVLMAFVNLFNIFNSINYNFSTLNLYWISFISVALTLLCLLFYITTKVIPQKAEELLEETYPEYKLVNSL